MIRRCALAGLATYAILVACGTGEDAASPGAGGSTSSTAGGLSSSGGSSSSGAGSSSGGSSSSGASTSGAPGFGFRGERDPTFGQAGIASVAVYDASGALDTSFGSGGLAKAVLSFSPQAAEIAVPDASGRVVVLGNAGYQPAIVRFTAAGAVDTTFGKEGSLAGPASGLPPASAIAIRGNGKIVIAGRANDGAIVAQLDDRGALDTSFGTGGSTKLAETFAPDQVLALESGGTLVSGVKAAPAEVVVARLGPTGAVDPTFAGSGLVKEPVATGAKALIAVQPDGAILVVTSAVAASGAREDILLLRYTSAGVLDTSFGDAGRKRLTLSGGSDVAEVFSLLADATAFVAGSTWSPSGGKDAMLLRLR